ncbi:MAG: DUF11 domain-containing protein, partial [Myxococcales bacterium]|nr:DUF11 domain-containing protein [Myxococcales bacterium]
MRLWAAPLAALFLLWPAGPSLARVEGDAHQLYQQFRVFGDALSTGNTLMQSSVADPRVNSFLLPQSGADVRDVPFDGEVVGAFLFWSGSLAGRVDRQVDFTVADGTTFRNVQAERCATVNGLGGFFYCRADVTNQVAAHPGARQYNGRYTVGQLEADIGRLVPDGMGGVVCEDPQTCQAKYAAWSLVLVYESPSARGLRDVFLYDGFRNYDEDARSPGIDQFQIQGFDFPADGEASLAYFALEGDLFLGVPPQDNDPLFACDTCFDFLEFNGVRLQDGVNPAGNLFNSTTALGVDLEGFRVSDLIQVGAQRATIRVGSGDGVVDPRNPDPAGGGESFFLGYVLLNVDRNAPDFRRDGTILSVVPDEGAPLERVVITLQLENEGTLDAQQVAVRLSLPDGLTYLPGSLRVDGQDPVPGEEVVNPLEAGLELGRVPFQGDNDRTITFRATIDADTRPGQRLVSQAFISAANLDEPTPTNEAVLVVLGGLELGQITKRVSDTDGDGRYSPGELVRYEISIPNPNNRDVAGVTFRDTLPPALELLQAVAPGGDNRSQPAQNRVDIRELIIPAGPNGGLTVTILARIKDTAGLVAAGIPAGSINGFPVDNQAEVVAAGRTLRSDDPTTAGVGDATRFRLSAAVDITGPNTRKTVEDLNGGFVEPGDTLRFTIQVANTGTAPAEVFVSDPLPALLEGCQLESPQPDLVCAGGRLQGLVSVAAGGREQIVFTTQVAAGAQNGQVIQNVARLRASADPNQQPEVSSAAVRVFASPSLTQTTKIVLDRGDGVAVPGDRLVYRIRVPNTGNRPATGVVLTDALPFDFAQVIPANGGVFDAGTNTLTWALGDIPPGGEVEVGFEAVLPPMVADGTRIANQAFVRSAELGMPVPSDDPGTAQADDPTTLVVRSQARLQVRKTVEPREGRPGDAVTWRITVTNDGNDRARALQVSDPIPTDAVEDVVVEGGALVDGVARWDVLGELAVGAERALVVRGRLRAILRDGLVVSNQATASAQGIEPRLSDDPATAEPEDPTRLVVRSEATFTVTKAVVDLNGGQVQPGDRLRYELSLRATGTSPLTALVFEDPLPPELVDVAVEDGGRLLNGRITWAVVGPVRPDDGAPLTV